jgi:hypothetical protein
MRGCNPPFSLARRPFSGGRLKRAHAVNMLKANNSAAADFTTTY